MNGFLLINKESDWTSRDVCNKVQSIFNLPKVGHIGTLDPFACGLLVVSVGKGTKAGRFIEELDKTYIACLTLGTKTSTGDRTGEILEHLDVPSLDSSKVKTALNSLVGEIEQIPPLTSAIHYNGRKLYTYAHQGIEVEVPSRKVFVKSLELLSINKNFITFKAEVSKGTYIRTLGEQIAGKLGTVGYLSYLLRTNVGKLSVKNAKRLDKVSKDDLISISEALINIPQIEIDEIMVDKAKSGVNLRLDNENNLVLLVDKYKNAVAVYQKNDKVYTCVRGLW